MTANPMKGIGVSLRLLLALTVAFSLLAIPEHGTNPSIPIVHTVRGCVCPNQPWTPAGPSMDTLTYTVYADDQAEFTALQATPPQIDITDWPLDPATLARIQPNTNFMITSPI